MPSNAMRIKNIVITGNGMFWTGKGFATSSIEARKYSSYSKAQSAIAAARLKCSVGTNLKMDTLPNPFDDLL